MKKLNLKVKSWVVEEQNPFHDPTLSNNGGGYCQPLDTIKGVVNNQTFELVIDNQSCGDFGKDITITLTINNKDVCIYILDTIYGVEQLTKKNEYFVRLMVELLEQFDFEKYACWVNNYSLPF